VKILDRYLIKKFSFVFVFCLLSLIILYLIMDGVENMDRFIDRRVPWFVTAKYYLFYTPSVMVMIMPVVTLLAAVFSIGTMAKNNEMVAMKSLGFSLYQVTGILLMLSFLISLAAFGIAEWVAAEANKKKEEITRTFLTGETSPSGLHDLQIQEQDGTIVQISRYDEARKAAVQVRIETFSEGKMTERVDVPEMKWDGSRWFVEKGYKRNFRNESETAVPIDTVTVFSFEFKPEDFRISRLEPEEMGIQDLFRFMQKIKKAGGRIQKWQTDFQMRFSFPVSNFFIVLLSVPLAYNRRKKSIVVGFGISLVICFFYFGIVKLGQSMGHNGSLQPWTAAWLGNLIACFSGILNLVLTRK